MEIPGYEIKRQIGQGGMATAYLAEQQSLGRQVVLKILDTKVKDTPETVERFLNEGRIIASLNHPHIITIYDIGQSGQEVYISMEYVEGGDLKQRLQKEVFAPHEAIDVIEKIASGLDKAHENGIVHRDVKPGNVLFRADGTPLLSDFGIAKRLSGDNDLTSTGMFLGSPNYMAPEQSEAGPIDGRADLYSLGVILFEMLSGQRAYTADSVIDVIVMHKKAPIPKLPAGLESFQELIELMMAKDRRDRFRDAASLVHFIDGMRKSGVIRSPKQLADSPDIDITGEHELASAAPPPEPLTERERPRKRTRKLTPGKLALIGALAACGVGWGVLLSIERDMKRPPPVRAEVAESIEAIDISPPAGEKPLPPAATAEERAQVGDALLWLGHHSIDEMRLTTPPQDNAYYYFSRLLQLDPTHARAQEGMKKVAAQYAFLAEREIAQDRFDDARKFIAMGLQIDGGNESLRLLAELVEQPKTGFWGALGSFFK